MTELVSDDIISEDGLYRYWLTRMWDTNGTGVIFVAFNPSKARAEVRDSTDKKCEGFSRRRAGIGWYGILNPFAIRATDPDEAKALFLAHGEDYVIGPENNENIIGALRSAKEDGNIVVVAWGTLGGQKWAKSRIADVVQQCRHESVQLHCLGVTKEGHPRHPLMVPYKQPIVPLSANWTPPA